MSTARDAREDLGASSQPAVRFDGVWLKRGDQPPVLRGVSFALAPGSFNVLIGARDSGKTALMRLMCLAEAPSQGVVQVFGRDVLALRRQERTTLRRRIGAALQPTRFLDHLTAWDNAALGPRITGRKLGDYAGEVDEVLAWMGLTKLADALPVALTVAERQRLAIARAVVGRPELLLVDEPHDGLDPAELTRLLKVLDEIHRTGATVLLATCDAKVAAGAGRPILRLQDGKASHSDAESFVGAS
jgi:cell division transport system ATP-binding protein